MSRSFIYIFLIFCFGIMNPVYGMKEVEEKVPTGVSYKLPKTINRDELITSSVMIQCGVIRGTGIAIGEKHILTAAHILAPYAMEKQKISCAAISAVHDRYFIPTIQSYKDSEGRQHFTPNFSECDLLSKTHLLRELNIIKVYFHPNTSFKESDESPKSFTFKQLKEKYKEVMGYGIENDGKLTSYGVRAKFVRDGKNVPTDIRMFGPDIAIIECETLHNLPLLKIAEPIKEDRMLVHIIGLSGTRYASDYSPINSKVKLPKVDSSGVTGGTVCTLQNEPVFVYIPYIYGQRFKCLPADANGLKHWINRPFMKVFKNQYFLEPENYPNAPEGFGLLRDGDSGAGAIIVQNGEPYLVGVASFGGIEPLFRTLQEYFSQKAFNPVEIAKQEDDQELFDLYLSSMTSQDKNKKWFITQGLADVTHLKSWINPIIEKK